VICSFPINHQINQRVKTIIRSFGYIIDDLEFKYNKNIQVPFESDANISVTTEYDLQDDKVEISLGQTGVDIHRIETNPIKRENVIKRKGEKIMSKTIVIGNIRVKRNHLYEFVMDKIDEKNA